MPTSPLRSSLTFAAALCAVLARAHTAQAQESSLAALRTAAQGHGAQAQLELGRALRRAGHFDEALAMFRQSAHDAQRMESLYEMARVRFDQADFRGAQNACNVLPAGRPPRDPVSVPRHTCLARSYLIVGRAALADREIAEAKRITPNDPELLLVIADAARTRGELQNTEPAYRAAIAALPGRVEPLLGLATFYESNQRLDEADAQYRAAVQAAPHDPQATFALGRFLLRRRSNATEALPHLQLAVAERARWPEALVVLGDALIATGNHTDALTRFTEVVTLSPTLPGGQSGLGRSRLAAGQFAEAEAPLRLAIQQVPNDAEAYMALADTLAKTSRGQEALEIWNQAIDLQQNEVGPRMRAADLAHSLGQNTLARAYLDRVIGDHANYAPALVLRADIAMDDRDPISARALYERALTGEGTIDRARVQARIAEIDAPRSGPRRR